MFFELLFGAVFFFDPLQGLVASLLANRIVENDVLLSQGVVVLDFEVQSLLFAAIDCKSLVAGLQGALVVFLRLCPFTADALAFGIDIDALDGFNRRAWRRRSLLGVSHHQGTQNPAGEENNPMLHVSEVSTTRRAKAK